MSAPVFVQSALPSLDRLPYWDLFPEVGRDSFNERIVTCPSCGGPQYVPELDRSVALICPFRLKWIGWCNHGYMPAWLARAVLYLMADRDVPDEGTPWNPG